MTRQLGLLSWSPPAPAPRATEQGLELARVEGAIGSFIVEWCRGRIERGEPQFHLSDLSSAVQAACGGAPDSASRILRQLRKAGHVAYVVESRSESLYRLQVIGGRP